MNVKLLASERTIMAVQPISPSEAIERKITMIPDFVIETVNEMLAEQATKNPYIVLRQDEIIKRIMARVGHQITKGELYEKKWLDFEPLYEKAGWKIEYDKPAYNESYEPTFTFKKA
jgi:hypothetical protein